MNENKPYTQTDETVRATFVEGASEAYCAMSWYEPFADSYDRWLAAHDAQVARKAVDAMAERFQWGGWFNALIVGDKLANANHVTAWMRNYIATNHPEESLDA